MRISLFTTLTSLLALSSVASAANIGRSAQPARPLAVDQLVGRSADPAAPLAGRDMVARGHAHARAHAAHAASRSGGHKAIRKVRRRKTTGRRCVPRPQQPSGASSTTQAPPAASSQPGNSSDLIAHPSENQNGTSHWASEGTGDWWSSSHHSSQSGHSDSTKSGHHSTSTEDSETSSAESSTKHSTSTKAWDATSTDPLDSTPTESSTKSRHTSTADASDASSTDSSATSTKGHQPTSTKSSNPTETSSGTGGQSSGGGGSSTSTSFVQPWGGGSASWTTCPAGDSNPLGLLAAFADLQFGKLPKVANAPDSSSAFVNVYPAGQFGQGFNFYAAGQLEGVQVQNANEISFAYSVWFDKNFDWVKGGKLPGIYGGESLAAAKSCSGGRQSGRDDCFSIRMMWRPDGAGEVYNYLPTSVKQAGDYCSHPPKSVCNPSYGDSIGRGSWTFKQNAWNTVALRVKLNDVGQANGEIEVSYNGQSSLSVKQLQIRTSAQTKFYGVMAETFFGGSDSSWAPPTAETAYFKDFTMTVL